MKLRDDEVLAKRAARITIAEQVASVAILQRYLRVGYAVASRLIDILINSGVIRREADGASLSVARLHFNRHHRRTTLDTRGLYVDKVMETALFFFEMHEEDCAGNTGVMDIIKPANISNMKLREYVLHECIRDGQSSLTETVLLLDQWLRKQNVVPTEIGDVTSALRTASKPYNRPPLKVQDFQERLFRACIRLARYYKLMFVHGTAVNNDSRVPDKFVPIEWIRPQPTAGWHPEHVVPVAYIRDTCIQRFDEGWTIEEVARIIHSCLLLIDIPKTDSDRLDKGNDNLKHVMPAGWEPITGCIYQRLHERDISFTPAPSYPCRCTAGHNLV